MKLLQNLLADIGGYMGILLGYSLLSFYDIAKNVWKNKLWPLISMIIPRSWPLVSAWSTTGPIKNHVESK